ncbi:hypothetical protein N9A76_00255 [Mariniblastus sp.]|nr:hypothetical protein [Mariniblastus sp.]
MPVRKGVFSGTNCNATLDKSHGEFEFGRKIQTELLKMEILFLIVPALNTITGKGCQMVEPYERRHLR